MSDEEQRSLSGYKSTIHEQQDFKNPNEGKPPLDDSTEYIFKLQSFPRVITTPQIKEKKDGTRNTIKVDKAVCEFEEVISKNIATSFFRVDSLNFSEEETYESGVVRFFKKIKTPLVEGVAPDWDKYFVVGMRFRGRVVIGKDGEKKPDGRYFLDVPTCRPLLPSDKEGETFDAPATPPETNTGNPSLANALLIAHGCANKDDAYQRLLDAKVKAEVVQAFLDADKRGILTYPL